MGQASPRLPAMRLHERRLRHELHGQVIPGPRAVDLRPLGWSRAALGLLFLIRTTPLLAPFHIWALSETSPLLGWPDDRWHGAAVGVALPPAIVASLCIVRTAAAAAFMLGIATRAAGLVACAAGYLVLAQRP